MDTFVKDNSTIILYAYRYIWKTKDGKLNVKILVEPQAGHVKFQQSIRNDGNIVSCMREYLHEINFAYFGFTESVKTEEKEEKENEDIQEKEENAVDN